MANDKETITNQRREFLLEVVNVDQLKGLEIGPLNEPLVTNEDLQGQGEIFYLDHLSTDDLQEKYSADPSVDVENIVDVDFVCPDGNLVEAVVGNQFDYVVASHVIEHAPNLLRFLCDINNILKPGGSCILIIPDKRFTFDVNRPNTTFGEVLEKFLLEAKRPHPSEVYDHFAMATHANGHNLWHGIFDSNDAHLLNSEKFAFDAARRVHDHQKYYDVHVNIFTPQSFFEVLKKAVKHNVVSFEVKKFIDTQIGQIEFMAHLRKPESGSKNIQKSECLKTFPDIQLESLLSPYMPQVRALSAALQTSSDLNLKLKEELRATQISSRAEIERLQGELQVVYKVLKRKSVRLVLLIIDKFYATFKR